jgi:hypothetical protein
MADVTPRGLLNILEILPLPYKYIFVLINITVNNQEHFEANSATHSANTRNKHLSVFQIYAYYAHI